MLATLALLMSFIVVAVGSAVPPDTSGKLELSFKPNPFAASVDVSFHLEESAEDLVLGVYDANNAQRARIDLGAMEPGEHVVVIPTSRWRNGVYVFVLTGEDGRMASGSAMKLGIEPTRNDSLAVFPF
jgi:hypothetical protein